MNLITLLVIAILIQITGYTLLAVLFWLIFRMLDRLFN